MQALERILAVLEVASRYPNGVLPSRVAEETNLSLSTVVRLMQSLHDDDVLLRSAETGQYRIGSRLIGLVARSTRSFDVRAAAEPVLQQLRDTSGGETAALHIRSGPRRICLAAAYTTHSTGRIVPIGLPLPLVGSAVGRVLLSCMTDADLSHLLETLALGSRAEQSLRKQLAEVRAQGYAESVNDSVEGIRGVAVPIGKEDGHGCLSISGPSDRFVQDMVLRALERLRYAANVFEQSTLQPSTLLSASA